MNMNDQILKKEKAFLFLHLIIPIKDMTLLWWYILFLVNAFSFNNEKGKKP